MKKIKIIFLILFMAFAFKMNVSASNITCNYKSTYGDTITISIKSDSLEGIYTNVNGVSQPFYPMNIIAGSQSNFMVSDDGYYAINGSKVAACPKSIENYYNNNPFDYLVEVSYMKGSSLIGETKSMPIIYFSTTGTTSDNKEATLLSLFSNGGVSKNNFANYKSRLYSFRSGKSDEQKPDSKGYIYCNYKNNTYTFKLNTNGDFIDNYYKVGSGEYKSIKLVANERNYLKACPEVIKISSDRSSFEITTMQSCQSDNSSCLYEENVSPYYGGADKLLVRYKLVGGSEKILIYKEFNTGTLYAKVNNNKVEISDLNSSNNKTKFDNKNYYKYIVKDGSNYYFSDSKVSGKSNYKKNDDFSGLDFTDTKTIEDCKDLFSNTFLTFMDNYIIKVIQIAVPILLILLTSFDFAKIVFSDDEKAMSTALSNLKTRGIAAVLIFLTPMLLIWIANLLGAPPSVTTCIKEINKTENKSS